jgi:hypothetical protein
MYSFWATYKGSLKKDCVSIQVSESGAMADIKVLKEWKKSHTNKTFPIGGDFTGITSATHGPKEPIQVSKCCDHEATKSLASEGYKTADISELYNNFYVLESVKPLPKGTRIAYRKEIAKKHLQGKRLSSNELAIPKQESEAVFMWQIPQGKSELIGLNLGHDISEWQQEEFQSLINNSAQYLYNNKNEKK